MKPLAKLFSTLVLACLVGAVWLMIQPNPGQILPSAPQSQPQTPGPSDPSDPSATPAPGGPAQGVDPGPALPPKPPISWRLPDIFSAPAPPAPVQLTSAVQRIVIEKAARRMTVYQQQGPEKTYRIALGRVPEGTKSRQGDGRTPEGVFKIDRLNNKSRFHLSLGLDYPQKQHRADARRAGVDPGGDIMIHGQPNEIASGYRVKGDWTEGCIAVDDHEIEELFAHTKIGTQVEIRP